MKDSIKNLHPIYAEFSKQYFSPEIERAFDKLGKHFGTYDYIKPFSVQYQFDDIEFLIRDKHFDDFKEYVKLKMLVDENFQIINNKTVIPIMSEYGKGFYKGYIDFKNPLKPNIPENNIENRKLVYEIY